MDGVNIISSAGADDKNNDQPIKPKSVMVLAATNRPFDLDEAIRRRLEKRIYIPLPSTEGRRKLFEINLKDVSKEKDVNIMELVRLTDGYSGADIANVCREAAMMPMRRRLDEGLGLDESFNLDELADKLKNPEKMDIQIRHQDLVIAITKTARSVSTDLLN